MLKIVLNRKLFLVFISATTKHRKKIQSDRFVKLGVGVSPPAWSYSTGWFRKKCRHTKMAIFT